MTIKLSISDALTKIQEYCQYWTTKFLSSFVSPQEYLKRSLLIERPAFKELLSTPIGQCSLRVLIGEYGQGKSAIAKMLFYHALRTGQFHAVYMSVKSLLDILERRVREFSSVPFREFISEVLRLSLDEVFRKNKGRALLTLIFLPLVTCPYFTKYYKELSEDNRPLASTFTKKDLPIEELRRNLDSISNALSFLLRQLGKNLVLIIDELEGLAKVFSGEALTTHTTSLLEELLVEFRNVYDSGGVRTTPLLVLTLPEEYRGIVDEAILNLRKISPRAYGLIPDKYIIHVWKMNKREIEDYLHNIAKKVFGISLYDMMRISALSILTATASMLDRTRHQVDFVLQRLLDAIKVFLEANGIKEITVGSTDPTHIARAIAETLQDVRRRKRKLISEFDIFKVAPKERITAAVLAGLVRIPDETKYLPTREELKQMVENLIGPSLNILRNSGVIRDEIPVGNLEVQYGCARIVYVRKASSVVPLVMWLQLRPPDKDPVEVLRESLKNYLKGPFQKLVVCVIMPRELDNVTVAFSSILFISELDFEKNKLKIEPVIVSVKTESLASLYFAAKQIFDKDVSGSLSHDLNRLYSEIADKLNEALARS